MSPIISRLRMSRDMATTDNITLWVDDYGLVIKPKEYSRPGGRCLRIAEYQEAPVAVRYIKALGGGPIGSTVGERAFIQAAQEWTKMSHPHLLPFLGLYKHARTSLTFVSPYMENGAVLWYLEKTPGASRLSIALDIARGLAYLHSLEPPFVHGDLRAANVFMGPSGEALLSKYGVASVMPFDDGWELEGGKYHEKGRWWATERKYWERYGLKNREESLTPASDVYSFGMTLYELYTGRAPYFEAEDVLAIVVHMIYAKDLRPTRLPILECSLFDEMWALMEQCWSDVIADRPTTSELIQRLEAFVNDPRSTILDHEAWMRTGSACVHCSISHVLQAELGGSDPGLNSSSLRMSTATSLPPTMSTPGMKHQP